MNTHRARPGVRKALAWSALNSVVLRIAGFASGVVVARLIAPKDFGVYAVALTISTILTAFADLGVSTDLIRNGRIRERAGTATTVALGTSAVLALLMVTTAGPVAHVLGSDEAAPVVRMMALTLLLNAVAVVPTSMLQRDFRQAAVFGVEATGFVLNTTLTIILILSGMGAMALAVARVVGQSMIIPLQFLLARVRPRLSLDRDVARGLVHFGVPIAAANMLSWVVMNVDYMIVGGIAGAVTLGFYLLAFNISNWPMASLGQAIRSVSLPAFSRLTGRQRADSLGAAVALAWGAAVLVGVGLANLAPALITVIYGPTWAPAAAALAGLAYFGATRVVIDLFASFLIAAGATRAVLLTQVAWLLGLVPAMFLGTTWFRLSGAGWAHVVAAVVVTLPTYLIFARATGASVGSLMRPLLVPLAAGVPSAAVIAFLASWLQPHPILAILVGGFAGTTVYVLATARWLLARYRTLRAAGRIPVDTSQPAAVTA